MVREAILLLAISASPYSIAQTSAVSECGSKVMDRLLPAASVVVTRVVTCQGSSNDLQDFTCGPFTVWIVTGPAKRPSASGVQGRNHQLRVATSQQPTGPFQDTGCVLVPDDPFTIDAHPFQDRDGAWYLFYARDFLACDGDWRVGTGIVVDRLLEMTALAGNPQVVIRPYADWQLFQARRPLYGGVYDWHTVEGPALRVHDQRYYCFYSGGAWHSDNYGVSYVVADHPLGPYRRPEHAGQLLKSAPGYVIGPGHNSFTLAPDGKQEFVVYHAWPPDMSARLMRIDPLVWRNGQPVIEGPTWTPQTIRLRDD